MRMLPWTLLAVLFACPQLAAGPEEVELSWYLPGDISYDPAIPTPASVLGWQVGEWHVRHDQLVQYFEVLAAASDRMSLRVTGETWEQRPLLQAAFTSPDNQRDLESLRQKHVTAMSLGEVPSNDRPVIVWMGYSVHGNEPSGSNAALVVAYHLAAAQGPAIDALLSRSVVLLDPAINPDGLARFAQWVNMHKGEQLVSLAGHREHREVWPGGRTNHYWFDLNRDWLLLTHDSTRARVREFHRWKPNVLTDHHEMGTSSTYFFQPGVPGRTNPRTPDRNQQLTAAIAEFHAQALDALGSLYYSEESFDDFYYGKGSTYPDVQGSVGILFEQASTRGHLRTNAFGELSFPFTIRNQVATSLSTLAASHALRRDLLDYQAEFVRTAREEAASDPAAGWVFGHGVDRARVNTMVELLMGHDVVVRGLARSINVNGVAYDPGQAYFVPHDQLAYRLVRSLFERRTEFLNQTFYDVSSWTLPLAFGLPHAELSRDDPQSESVGAALTALPSLSGRLLPPPGGESVYAWLVPWHGHHSPRALASLLDAGVITSVATRPLLADTSKGQIDFAEGTLIVPVGVQSIAAGELADLMSKLAKRDGLDISGISSGLTPRGIDLGSPSVIPLKNPKPVVVVGPGTSSYEAGEVWFQLDQRWKIPVALIEGEHLGGMDLSDITHVIMVSGAQGGFSAETASKLSDWVSDGGVLIGLRRGAAWAGKELLQIGPDDSDNTDEAAQTADPPQPSYADYEAERAKKIVSGALFSASLDRTHPLGFGYMSDELSLFKAGTTTMTRSENPIEDALIYTDSPLLSGYASTENVESIAGTAAASARRVGSGTVVRIIDNPNFRGFWHGTSKLFANAFFFGHAVKRTSALDEEADDIAQDEDSH